MVFYLEANGVFLPACENEIQFVFISLWKIGKLTVGTQLVKNSILEQRAFPWISQNTGEAITMFIR